MTVLALEWGPEAGVGDLPQRRAETVAPRSTSICVEAGDLDSAVTADLALDGPARVEVMTDAVLL